MRDGLYHSMLGFPEGLLERLPRDTNKIVYCPHALQRAKARGINRLPQSVKNCEIPEIEVIDGEIVKALYKTKYSPRVDICLVFHIKFNQPYMVRTLWVNNISHKITIDKTRYVHVHE